MQPTTDGGVTAVNGDDLYKKAVKLLIEGKELQEAFHYFNLLFNHSLKDPTHSETILFHIGSCAQKLGYPALAVLAFKQCVQLRSDFPEANNNLGCIYKDYQRDSEAVMHFTEAMNIAKTKEGCSDKDKAEYQMNLGSMYIANGTPKKAIKYFDRAEKLDPKLDMIRWNRSLAYLESGDYARGFDEYEFGERQLERMKKRDFGISDLPFWDGSECKDKTIVVTGEQGLGDEIMFASMIPDLIPKAQIIIEAHPRLKDLFHLNFPGIPVYGTRKDESMIWPQYHKLDYRILMGSLAKFFRRKAEDFPGIPYLKAHPGKSQKYREIFEGMGKRMKIGISWRGGSPGTGKKHRYIPMEKLLPILRLDADFFSLQYDKDIGGKVADFEKSNGVCLNHWQRTIDSYDETAAMVENLDLIISVPQSVVNLAGAIGTPVWQMAPFKALWQVGVHGQDTPWYKCVKNFWQSSDCRWEPVIEKVRDELCSLLQKRTGN